jgi:hypothetical protein
MLTRFVLPPCLACGGRCEQTFWSGAVGPFCGKTCRDKNDDTEVWQRATDYAARLVESRRSEQTRGPEVIESDVARAFVIGFAAGVERENIPARRRTVKR